MRKNILEQIVLLIGLVLLLVGCACSGISHKCNKFKQDSLVRHITGGPNMVVVSCECSVSYCSVLAEFLNDKKEIQRDWIRENHLIQVESLSAERFHND